MADPEQPAAKRTRFDTSNGQVASSAAAIGTAPAKPVTAVDAKAVLERARAALEKKKALDAKLRASKVLSSSVGAASGAPPSTAAVSRPKTGGPAPLRLDEQGREVDEQGRPIERRPAAPALKANQRVEPSEDSKKPEGPKVSFYDPDVGDRGLRRMQRKSRPTFDFVKQGVFQRQAERQRLSAQFGEEASKPAKPSKKVAEDAQFGEEASKPAKAEKVVGDVNAIPLGQRAQPEPKKPAIELEPIPEVEWWDARLLRNSKSYSMMKGGEDISENIKLDRITHYVEHPIPIEPPIEEAPAAPMPLMLTTKERKKIRTQKRMEREKEKQELIRQGLLDPPKPKVKLSNLMRVLGTEAVLDPSAMEKQVRDQMAERQAAHDDRNLARKLTPAEKKEKKHNKLVGQAAETDAPTVNVYRVASLADPRHRFKVRVNADELHLTGCAVAAKDSFAVVVVEGGPKALKFYKKLMLKRMKWHITVEAEKARAEGEGEDEPAAAEDEEGQANSEGAILVWQGNVKAKTFDKFSLQDAASEENARKWFEGKGLVHYWDLCAAAVPPPAP